MGSFKFLLLFPIWRFYYFIHSPKNIYKKKEATLLAASGLINPNALFTVSLLFQYEQLVYLHLIF